MFNPLSTHKLIVVNDWQDHYVTNEIMGDCMMMLAQGVYYHVRLDLYVIIRKDLSNGIGSYFK
jgi:hypothetical protein